MTTLPSIPIPAPLTRLTNGEPTTFTEPKLTAVMIPAPGIWFGVGAATAAPAPKVSASAATTGFNANLVFTAEVMMVFLPLLVDETNVSFHRAPGAIHSICYFGPTTMANACEAMPCGAGGP